MHRERRTSRKGMPQALAMAALAGATACGESPVGREGPPAPRVVAATIATAPGPIFRTLAVELDAEAHVVVDYGVPGGERLRTGSRAPAPVHEMFLGRLRPDREYTYEARAVTLAGDTGTAVTGSFSTGSLPPQAAAFEVSVSGEAGFDLLFLEIGRPSGPHFPFIVDPWGEVVWYSLHEGRTASGFTILEDSLFAFNTAEGIHVVSPASQELVASLSRARAGQRAGGDALFIHHDVTATAHGTLLFLALDPTVAGDTVWMGEAVWEWDPRSDELERRWTSDHFLDPATDRGPRSRPDDWLHANGLAIGPRGNVLVSFFWLHEVLSIAPDWQSVEWRLGGPASTFQGVETEMEAGQHTPAEVAPDRILLFDNGLDRAEGRFSRALEIALDCGSGTAEVAWEFRPTPDVFAPIVSSVHRLENGNTFVNFGLAPGLFGGTATGPLVFLEVTPDGSEVWRMEVEAGAELVYRATPIATVAGEHVMLTGPADAPGPAPRGGRSRVR